MHGWATSRFLIAYVHPTSRFLKGYPLDVHDLEAIIFFPSFEHLAPCYVIDHRPCELPSIRLAPSFTVFLFFALFLVALRDSQDHEILKALKRDRELCLLPLLVYVFTHELVHIVRFCNFLQRFEVTGREKEKEERIVHDTTYKILRRVSMPDLDYVLDSYEGHRVCEMAVA